MSFSTLHEIAEHYSKEWRDNKSCFQEPRSGFIWDEKGRELVFDAKTREGIKDRMLSCLIDVEQQEQKLDKGQKELEGPVIDYMTSQLGSIAEKIQELALNIQNIMNVENENVDDMFGKMTDFELYSERIVSEVDELNNLEDMFYRGDLFPEQPDQSIGLSFSLAKALKDFLKNSRNNMGYFLEGAVPILIQFLGFMATEFPKAMRKGLKVSFSEITTTQQKPTPAPLPAQTENKAQSLQQSAA